jgi:Ca-activated chloride channel family protein
MKMFTTESVVRSASWRIGAVAPLVVVFVMMTLTPASSLAADPRAAAKPGVIVGGSQGGQQSTLELPSVPASQTTLPQVTASAPQQELVIPARQLRTQPGYAQVTVTVTDPRGGYVTGLQKDDFKLFLDGRARPVEFFRQDMDTPVSVGILVDTSGSMLSKIPQAQAAIAEFIRGLNPQDQVFLFAFSGQPFLLQPFTTDHSLVLRRLNLLHARGQTALFDVIRQGLLMVQRGKYDKKALLVVTDGNDTASRSSVDEVIMQARRMGVLVYSIGIGDPNATFSGAVVIGPFVMGGVNERVDAQTLYTLSTETGAKTFIVRQVGDGEMLRRACADISRELRQQYTIGFVAPDASAGGYRSLKVDVPTHKDASVRVRKGLDMGGSHSGYADASDGSTATVP